MIELFKEIWSTAKRNKLRTSLTGFAVAWGIFMIIFLLGAGNGLINAQLDQQSRHLANSIKIFGGQTSKPFKGLEKGRFITLKESDVEITDKISFTMILIVYSCLAELKNTLNRPILKYMPTA